LVSLILECGSEASLLDLCLWGKKPGGRTDDLKRPAQRGILDRIAAWKLNDAWRAISCIESGLRGSFADSDHLSLALYWSVMVQRVLAGHTISMPDGQIEAQRRLPEHQAVRAAAEVLRKETGLRLPEAEEAQLTLEVLTSSRPPEGRRPRRPRQATDTTGWRYGWPRKSAAGWMQISPSPRSWADLQNTSRVR
jgi:hypothetical protein